MAKSDNKVKNSKKSKKDKTSKKNKSKKSKKEEQKTTPEPVQEQEPVVETPAETKETQTPTEVSTSTPTPADTPDDTPSEPNPADDCKVLQDRFSQLVQTLQARIEADKALLREVRELQRDVSKHHKVMVKTILKGGKKKKKKKSGNHKPSGITKPTGISDELCDFLGVDHGTLLARTEVTKRISAYYKEHSLQVPEDKRLIKPDKALKKLLKCGNEPFIMFKLQTFLKDHFIKTPAVAEASA